LKNPGPLFAAVEVGTTGARAVVIDLDGIRIAEVRRPYRTNVSNPGWAEQDALDWSERAVQALQHLPARVKRCVVGLGLTGQSPSVVPVNRRGRPVGPGLIYRDNRAVIEAADMRRRVGAEKYHDITGHTPEAFHVGPKVLWLREHAPKIFRAANKFLQPRDVVLHRLTGQFLTDESHANCTLFFDITSRQWSNELFSHFELDSDLFPDVVPSWTVVENLSAKAAAETGLQAGIPIVIGAGDSQCVAFGAGVTERGPISEMSGASSCLNSVVDTLRRDQRITHYNHVVPDRLTTEVGVNTTGAALQWAVKQLGFAGFEDLSRDATTGLRRLSVLAENRNPCDVAPIFLPYMGDGERDDPTIRGAFIGLSDRHDRVALAYSVIEGVALGVVSEVAVLQRAGSPLEELRVSGGGAQIAVLGRIKSHLLGRPVCHLEADASANGAALLSAQAAGFSDEVAVAVRHTLSRSKRFQPIESLHDAMLPRQRWFESARRASALHRANGPEEETGAS
jgi:xylulokinase